MSSSAIVQDPPLPAPLPSTGEELMALGWEINANQHRVVHLAARFDEELEWFRQGLKSASRWIGERLQIESSTAREWIRVGYSLRYLPLTDAAFEAQEISYAKARIVTRWADADNEAQLLELARERTAGRLSVAIARFLADAGETDEERDLRLHDERSLSTWPDGDGMTVVRIVLPPSVAKPVVAAVDELVRRIAETPIDTEASDAPAGVWPTERGDGSHGGCRRSVRGRDWSAHRAGAATLRGGSGGGGSQRSAPGDAARAPAGVAAGRRRSRHSQPGAAAC